MSSMRILTWNVHGNYLYYLARASRHQFVVPHAEGVAGHSRLTPALDWPANIKQVDVDQFHESPVDVVLYQGRANYLYDRNDLSAAQRALPSIYLEHDPPTSSPTEARHPADDVDLIVHVTQYNRLMWDTGSVPARVIDHGVSIADGVRYSGELGRGIVVINNLGSRGRRLGADLVQYVRTRVPLDIVGMGSEECGGLGEVPARDLPDFMSRYRFFFHPARYTSLGLAILEAMMGGVPVLGLATTELASLGIDGGVIANNDIDRLVGEMVDLIDHPDRAARLGSSGQQLARRRFNLARFGKEWDDALEGVADGARESEAAWQSASR